MKRLLILCILIVFATQLNAAGALTENQQTTACEILNTAERRLGAVQQPVGPALRGAISKVQSAALGLDCLL